MGKALNLVIGATIVFGVCACNAANLSEPTVIPPPQPPSPVDATAEANEAIKAAAEPDLTVFGGKETADALFFNNAIPGFSIKLPSGVYADGVIISVYCPTGDCPQPPLLVLRAIEGGAVAHVDGEEKILIREETRAGGNIDLGVFNGVEIVAVGNKGQ